MSRGDAPKRYPRTARLNEVLREVIADEVERLSDRRLGFVTITGVDVSADLRHASVFYSVLGPEEQHAATHAALRAAGGHLRAVVGRQVRMKYLPRLDFVEDPAVAAGARIDEIIRELHAPPGADPPPEQV